MHDLHFEKLIDYDLGEPGISLRVELRLGQEVVVVMAKIDTGASVCIFERTVGEWLGLEIELGRAANIGTVTGSFKAFAHEVTLVTEGFEVDAEVYFAEEESFHMNVLGRMGWLNQVILAINDYDGKLYLSPYNPR